MLTQRSSVKVSVMVLRLRPQPLEASCPGLSPGSAMHQLCDLRNVSSFPCDSLFSSVLTGIIIPISQSSVNTMCKNPRKAQLILEQLQVWTARVHLYVDIFQLVNTIVLHCPWLAESADAEELCMQRVTINDTQINTHSWLFKGLWHFK